LLDREEGAEVVGDGVEAAGVDQASARPLRRRVVAQVRLVDEFRLAGEST
jgi:hypothetical protein